MIIKSNGYAIWEMIQRGVDALLKKRGVKNCYFPLFIPESYLRRESEHVEGFAPELAVVTAGGGKKLDEPLVVRPTSETIVYETFSKWIQSYRDLPLAINQWANVVRWERRPRLFLRTTEFLWQEGHTVHEKAEEAEQYAISILHEVYKHFLEDVLAIPVFSGKKSEKEKFAGAKQTFCVEAMMQDGKSLQAGTAHDLYDNFSKAFEIKFLGNDGKQRNVFQSCWGISTRLIGGIIMVHGDDKGIILPPKIAPTQIAIIPIAEKDEAVARAGKEIKTELEQDFRVEIDERYELRPGEKYFEWEKRGVPIRIEIGPRDLMKKMCVLVRRDTSEKKECAISNVREAVASLLEEIHANLFTNALQFRQGRMTLADDWGKFTESIGKGCYVFSFWCERSDCEVAIKEKSKATTRCLPFDSKEENGNHKCVHCGKSAPSAKRWLFAQAY
jgi:prolyl-tRNA synthetase